MSNEFNPYSRWFDIPPEAQPPNHYVLLGLELFETDAAAIEEATEQRLIFLQDVANGPYTKDSQRLLNEVAAARLCLTDESRKATYDRMLQQRLANPIAPVQSPAIQNEALWRTGSAEPSGSSQLPLRDSETANPLVGGPPSPNIHIQENSASPSLQPKNTPRKAPAKKAPAKKVAKQRVRTIDGQDKVSLWENPVFIRNLLMGGAAVSVLITVIAIVIFFSGSSQEGSGGKSTVGNPASTNSQSDSPFAQSKFTGGSRKQTNKKSVAAVNQSDIARNGLIVWLDAGDPTTLELNQGRVKTWKDKSQQQHDAIQDNAVNQPLFKGDAVGGKPAVELGKPSYLSLKSTQALNLGDSYTIATVAWSDKGVLLGKGLPHKQDAPSAFSLFNGASRFRTSKSNYLEAKDDDPRKWKVRIAVADQKSFWWYVDGLNECLSAGRHSISNSDLLVIGRRLDDRSPEYANGALAELLIYKRAISDAERKQLEAYLTQKWLK